MAGLTVVGSNAGGTTDGVTASPTLSPGFKKDVTSYTTLVSNLTDTLTVTVTAHADADPPAVTSNKGADKVGDDTDTTPDDSVATHAVTLAEGANVITILVTAADLDTTKTYTLAVTRAAANASDDAKLSALMVGDKSVSVSGKGTLASDAAPTAADYMTGVANSVSSIVVSATPNHSNATVSIFSAAGDTAISHTIGTPVGADGMVGLSIERNIVRIQVTAENGSSVRNYFVEINRAAAGASSNADLAGLTVVGSNAGGTTDGVTASPTLSPGFKKDVTSYTTLVSNLTDTLTVTVTAHADADPPAVTSNKGADKVGDDTDTTPDDSVATHAVTLAEGANVITILVTAADLDTTKTYTLAVTRAAANASDDASLSALMVGDKSVSVSGKGTLASDAAPTAADYMTGVANSVSSIVVSATPNHSNATVSIFSAAGDTAISHTIGTPVGADGMVGLSIERNIVRIQVTAENGSSVRNYFVEINRASAGASSDAKLATNGLALSGITISPAFSPDTMMYSADVPVNIADTTVTATAAAMPLRKCRNEIEYR